MQETRRCKLVLWTFLAVLVLARVAAAQEQKPAGKPLDRKTLDESIYQSLRGIIDHGADLYNQGDWNGCYRLWEGSLLSLKPMLDHRPKLQEAIDGGLSKARQEAAQWQRAWTLRPVLDKIRADINADYPHKRKQPASEPPLAKDEPKKTEEKKPAEKKEEKKNGKKADDTARIEGKITYQGKSLTGGIISLMGSNGFAFSGTIDANGTYLLRVKPGEYKVAIDTKANAKIRQVPAKYSDSDKSGLTVNVREGGQTFDIALQ